MENMKKELISFWRKLDRMLNMGIPLLQTLNVISKETADERMREIILAIAKDIKVGSTMSGSIAKYPSCFPPSIQSIVEVGEATGTLDKVSCEIAAGLEDGSFSIGENLHDELLSARTESIDVKTKSLKEEDQSAPVVKAVSEMLRKALLKRASDIHIEWVKGNLRIRYRIDGVLHEVTDINIPKEMQVAVISRIKIMADMNVSEKRLPQDGRIRVNMEGRELDFRVSIVPYVRGESIVIRILDRQSMLIDLESQGFTKSNLEMLRKWSKQPNGIIIVTGPTGCGKTTTLYSLLQELNIPEIMITTVEDPVEYLIEGVNQQQVRSDLGLTFAHCIRSHLRQDPDILMAGEIRDLDTAYLVIQAALTGHLVLSTLHTQDAPGAVRRLLDMGVDPFLINSSLTGIVSQRLVRMICKDCKEEWEPSDWVSDTIKGHKKMKFFRGKGCDSCAHFGYRGRTAIHELLEVDEPMRRLIAQDADSKELRKQAVESGMIPLKEDGIAKAGQGITTVEEVLRVCVG